MRQVTITVGGNDVGLSQVLLTCFQNRRACQSASAAAFAALIPLSDELTTLLTEVREQAPNARIFVTGYPMLLQSACSHPAANSYTVCFCRLLGCLRASSCQCSRLAMVPLVGRLFGAENGGVRLSGDAGVPMVR